MECEVLLPHDGWVHDTIQAVFEACLSRQAKPSGNVIVLEDLDSTMRGPLHPNGGHLLTEKNMEVVLAESVVRQSDSSSYLCGCWQRCKELLDEEPQVQSHQHRISFLKECLALCSNYILLHFSNDDLFPDSRRGGAKLVDCLRTSARPAHLLDDLLGRVPAGEQAQVFLPSVAALIQEVRGTSIADDWKGLLQVLNLLASPEQICKAIVSGPSWLPSGNGRVLEDTSLLGPFFGLSATHPRARAAFLPVDEKGDLPKDYQWDTSALQNVRGHWGLLVELLHAAVMQNFLRPKYSREALLRWFAAVLNQNHERAKTQVDYNSCSSDCFMVNFAYVMLTLFDPVIAKDREKKDSVLASYVTSPSSRVQYDRFTRIAMDSETAKKAAHGGVARDFGFNTEAFFFAIHALHIGLLSASNHWTRNNEDLRHLKQAMEEAQQQNLAPLLMEFQMTQFRVQFNERLQLKFALDAVLFNPTLVRSVFRFCNYASLWLLRTAFASIEDNYQRPLPDMVPPEFAALPEFFVDSIADLALFYLRYGPRYQAISHDLDVHHLMLMVVHFMPSSKFITNPYVRSKFPEILYVIAMIERQVSRAGLRSVIADIFHSSIDPAHLIPALMVLYVDMEFLGGHNQFYEKFTPRYYIAELFNYLWDNPQYKQAFKQEATEKLKSRTTDHFVKFFNYLLNDANFLLEESLTCLKQIHEFEELQGNSAAWNALSQTEQADKTKAAEETKRKCKSFMRLGNETVNMMEYLSKELPAPFLQPELVDKVAAMLAYFLDMLVGKSVKELKVANARDYDFNHRTLIEKITHTFVNFSSYPEFHRAVAADGRSYSPERFEQAVQFVRSKNIINPMELQQFEELAQKLQAAHADLQSHDEMYGDDVPDHFMDPINYSIMSDPVKLPTSGNVVEKAVIIRHLLNDETDPFNRAKLTVAAVEEYNEQPDVKAAMDALKAEIEGWKRGKEAS